MGPAGAGKTTYCSNMLKHLESSKRRAHLFNLDPAAEEFQVEPEINITDLINVQDVMEELTFGPNGGLIFCLEHLIDNLDWLQDQLDDYDQDYLIVDCPGQIELYTHFPIMKQIVDLFISQNYKVCGVYLLDSQYIQDPIKFFAGVMSAMSAMLQLGIPHVNILTKMDLLQSVGREKLDRFLNADTSLLQEANLQSPEFADLNAALIRLVVFILL